MVKKILINNQEFIFTESDLPILVHGIEGSGASLFTTTIISQIATQGNKIFFFSGYGMAKDEFKEQVETIDVERVKIVPTGEENDLISAINNTPDATERIALFKNIDLLTPAIFPYIKKCIKPLISGDIDKCSFTQELLSISYQTIILFSPLEGISKSFPDNLQKYEGYMWGRDEGIVKVVV